MSGKRIVNAYKNVDTLQAYALKDAVKIVKDNATAKFDETIDVAINLGVDPKHADQMVRGVCSLPHGNGKKVRVAVLAQGEKADEAKAAGADIVGAENLIDSILAGKVDFDRCIATPDMMGLAGVAVITIICYLAAEGPDAEPEIGNGYRRCCNGCPKSQGR